MMFGLNPFIKASDEHLYTTTLTIPIQTQWLMDLITSSKWHNINVKTKECTNCFTIQSTLPTLVQMPQLQS
jgi:hypothetical protein